LAREKAPRLIQERDAVSSWHFARVAFARFRHFAKRFSPFPCKRGAGTDYAGMGKA